MCGGGGGSSVETVFWNVCSIKYMCDEVGNGVWTNYDHWTVEQQTGLLNNRPVTMRTK